MTVREFTSLLWYSQVVKIVIHDKDGNEKNVLAECPNYALRSALYEEINKMEVRSYGVENNAMVIVVK